MTFKEYLALEEELALLEGEALDALLAVPKFVAGTAGNLLGQNLRGVGNIAGGGLDAAYGLGSAGLGALKYLGGGKEGRKSAAEKVKRGLGRIGRGIGSGLRGTVQMAASPISAPIRGAQAVDDKEISGILAPNDPRRSYLQDLFGLDSGSPPPPEPESKPEPVKTKKKAKAKEPPAQAAQSTSDVLPSGWMDLMVQLKQSRPEERGKIIGRMQAEFPNLFNDLKRRLSQSRGRPSTNPSGLFRVPRGVRRPSV
jgi:hypothetical protein